MYRRSYAGRLPCLGRAISTAGRSTRVVAGSSRPAVYRWLFHTLAETPKLAWETGARLGQLSEFSLLLVFVALESGVASQDAASMVQLATILTFVASSYMVVLRYPTPIAISDRLRRD